MDYVFLVLTLCSTGIAITNAICLMTYSECTFHFNVDQRLTMMHQGDLVYPHDGRLYRYNVTNTSNATPIPLEEVITADGYEIPRLVTVVNGQFPGPSIVVYEGQTVIVYVKNLMQRESVTIHWHGLHQRGTPWMDGVPMITQCPVLPGQTFRYEFKAVPSGTFWWHSHLPFQTSMGVFGALIIKDRAENALDEHVLQIQDWNHEYDIETNFARMMSGVFKGRKRWMGLRALDGRFFSAYDVQSGLINGRGRLHENAHSNYSNTAPLRVFKVTSGRKYRFRVINTGFENPFRLSVDSHTIRIIACDGYDVRPFHVESFIVSPGERFDFELSADQAIDNYWIRGITLIQGVTYQADAILRYTEAQEAEPKTQRQTCSSTNVCNVLNCPFPFYPEQFTECIAINKLASDVDNDTVPAYRQGKFHEHFLNFAFPDIISPPGAVNGRTFHTPDVNVLSQSHEWSSPCKDSECGVGKTCKCTHTLQVGRGDNVQLVITNMGLGKVSAHPIHIHGHTFYVLKIGFGKQDPVTGALLGDSDDLVCRGATLNKSDPFCSDVTWADKTWMNGNIPGLELENPLLKDTIAVPLGGYVVIRIKADNPGLWLIHCHVDIHSELGMKVLLNESFSEIPKPPDAFPTCRSFQSSLTDKTEAKIPNTHASEQESVPVCVNEVSLLPIQYGLLGGVLTIILLQLIIITTILPRL